MWRRLGPAAAALVALAGCTGTPTDHGAATHEPGGATTSEDQPSTAPLPSETAGLGPGAGDLADLAEELAGDVAASTSIAPRKGLVRGADISWPQCPKGMGIPQRRSAGLPMPVAGAEYVVIGLTNGPAFTPNPCLADQVRWVAERDLLVSAYAVLSYPDDRQLADHGGRGPYDGDRRLGRLRNVGYQQAVHNLALMRRAGLRTPILWLDVEPVRVWEWSDDADANVAVVQGSARGYRDAGLELGVYSTPYLWDQIVGDFSLGVPEWRAAGQTSRTEALRRCGADWSIQGGRGVLAQWVAGRRDHDVTCPGVAADLGRWFHAG